MTTTATPTSRDEGLSVLIREAGDNAHQEAENAPFIQDLMAGKLSLDGYVSLVVQQHEIYKTLETALLPYRRGALAGLFDPVLDRLPSIESDLESLIGDNLPPEAQIVPATVRYCERLNQAARAGEPEILAHHYVRYMGDLSGGQVVGRAMARIYGFEGDRGTAFYRFDSIESPKEFKERYRAQLDRLDWDESHVGRLLSEVVAAFSLNTAVFYDLGSELDPPLLSGAVG